MLKVSFRIMVFILFHDLERSNQISLLITGKGDNCQVHCRSKAACKEGPSTASSVNASILIETARNSWLTKWKLACGTESFSTVVYWSFSSSYLKMKSLVSYRKRIKTVYWSVRCFLSFLLCILSCSMITFDSAVCF